MAGDRAIIHVAEVTEGKETVRTGPLGAGTYIAATQSAEAAAALAVDLVAKGVDTIELCGATGYTWVAEVKAAVRGRARVGTVLFGFESLLDVARYKEQATAGVPLTAIFIYVESGADPAVDRFEVREGGSRSVFIAVPHPGAGAAVAAELNGEAQLIELYGGFGPDDITAVINAVGERIPVGVAVHSEVPTPA